MSEPTSGTLTDHNPFQNSYLRAISIYSLPGASFEGGWGPSPPRKKKKKKKRRKKREKKKTMEERKKGAMNNVKLLHIKCCFFQFFNSPVALKIKFWPPKKKLK